MKLIIILLALAVDHFVDEVAEIRRFDWFNRYINNLEKHLSEFKFWNGAGGVLLTLAGPLLLLLFVSWLLSELFYPLAVVFAFGILLYSLGPGYLFPLLERYITALEEGDESSANKMAQSLVGKSGAESEQDMIAQILVQSNSRLFAVIFWFIVLGPFGALLYRLACHLQQRQHDIHGYYSDVTLHLKNILDWPATRLLVIGNALCGNMMDALEAWKDTERESLSVNESVLTASSLAALNYQPANEGVSRPRSHCFRSLQGLLRRTLILWLAVLGLMTLAGWLG